MKIVSSKTEHTGNDKILETDQISNSHALGQDNDREVTVPIKGNTTVSYGQGTIYSILTVLVYT